MRTFLVAICLLCWTTPNGFGDEPVIENLWPDNPPGVKTSNPSVNDLPRLIITKVESKTPTAAVVILPGGGYWGLSMTNEGYDFATWFESLGISSAICTYRVRGPGEFLKWGEDKGDGPDSKPGNDGEGYGHPYPMMDAQRAIQTLRARAQELNIDPDRIGVIGFSAGGHLASTVSTHFVEGDSNATDPIKKVSSRPNFSILCYPVIGLGKPYTHGGSQKNLLGDDADADLIASLSNESQITKQTPPTFLFHTAEDSAVPVQNSIEYFMGCQRAGVQAELHVFPVGRHGLGLAKGSPGAEQWPSLCEQWLSQLGVINP
ncbi:Acetylxylan esterase precursor [Rubripirellula amarantea]|uniref:Acetylxylan esterase n=1 Tax=Rubripirellula amarantea TaxID=2527999 RepID=A0A5C5WSI6_9BACT|nr:alpha/beta hydrolase [Rubripirellula amarantea]TWT53478.1 Acetylxylan esterase precursor [Rubripirellula amarantea]